MPAPVVSRLNTVVYGGFTVGGSTNYHLHGVTVSEQDYTTLTIRFQVFVNHDTTATFVTLCTALEAAYRVPNGDLVATLNSNNWVNLSHASNTGMLATPSIRKAGGGGDSNSSRIYDCSVTIMLPADESGKNGRQSAQVTLTEDGNEAIHLDVSAIYTAIGGNSALAQAQARFPTYVGTIQDDIGGDWDEYSARTYSHDVENKICRCSASYRQILSDQSQAGRNHESLQGVWSEVFTDRVGISADPGGTSPLVKIVVRFACRVRSTVTVDIRTTYTTIVRPHMIAIAQSYADNVSGITAIAERPGLRPEDNSINARMTFLAPGGSSLIRSDTNVAMVEHLPLFFEPVLDGGDYSRDQHSKPGFKGAAIAATVLILGTSERGGAGSIPFAAADAEVARLRRRNYHVVEKHEPVFKHIEFDGMGLAGKLSLLSIRRTVLMEKAILRTLPTGGKLTTQTQRKQTGNVFSAARRAGGGLSGSGWID